MSDAAFTPRTVLVTGGAGFIGSNLVRWILQHQHAVKVINLDLLTYAGNLRSLATVFGEHGAGGSGRHFFVHGDIRDSALVASLLEGGTPDHETRQPLPRPDAILHLAAETHVDRSVRGSAEFVSTNVLGTHTLLECVRRELQWRPRSFRFVNVSTDEVYGSLGANDPAFTEQHPLLPNSPYAASKAGADCLVRSYAETHGLACLTTRCSNNYGPFQFPEKLIPLMITRAMSDQPLPLYGDGLNVRDWIHVEDHAEAVWRVCTHGRLDDGVYNIGGESERSNVDMVREILRLVGKPESLITRVTDRAGHDRRYAIDNSRIRDRLGWQPRRELGEGLAETVAWYSANESWWKPLETEGSRVAESMYLGGNAPT